MCTHVAADEDERFVLRFTGTGLEFWLVCRSCAELAEPPLVGVCSACALAQLDRIFDAAGVRGRPEVRTRESGLAFEHGTIAVPGLAGAACVAAAGLVDGPRSAWLVVSGGALLRVDVEGEAGRVAPVLDLEGEVDEGTDGLRIEVAPDGRHAAVVERHGAHGVVIDVATGTITMHLDRGDYCVEHYEFSCAFVDDGGRSLLVHATHWNRLDISDPSTGELLTPRDTAGHDLDYFHAGLSVSPDGRWLVDDGWVWHPVGVLQRVDLQRWRGENPWETEDGPSRATLRACNYRWDVGRCFVDARTLVVWGFGPDDQAMVDAAVVFDVAEGTQLRWFAGPPRGRFVFDGHLVVIAAEETSVWDVSTGERLLVAPGFAPHAFHPGTREHATFGDGTVVLSRLVAEG